MNTTVYKAQVVPYFYFDFDGRDSKRISIIEVLPIGSSFGMCVSLKHSVVELDWFFSRVLLVLRLAFVWWLFLRFWTFDSSRHNFHRCKINLFSGSRRCATSLFIRGPISCQPLGFWFFRHKCVVEWETLGGSYEFYGPIPFICPWSGLVFF